jgi:hypothetical protein
MRQQTLEQVLLSRVLLELLRIVCSVQLSIFAYLVTGGKHMRGTTLYSAFLVSFHYLQDTVWAS